MLSGVRVIDCTTRLGWLAGRILGDLGADVLKIEAPGADLDDTDWLAWNVNKRLAFLDLGKDADRARLDDALAGADILIESEPPGGALRAFFDHARLAAACPGLIQVTITPFGLSGPRAQWSVSDIEMMAAGGAMSLAGKPGELPVRVTYPQSPGWAASHAVCGALTALHHKRRTGHGQQVDTSAQAAIITALAHAPTYPEIAGTNPTRSGEFIPGRSVTGANFRVFWPVADGYVNFIFYGGPAGRRTNEQLVAWMKDAGAELGMLADIDWGDFDVKLLTQEEVDRLEAPMGAFFKTVTKSEFMEETDKREMLGYPVSSVADIREDIQIAARGYFQEGEAPDGARHAYCGSFVLVDGTRPPLQPFGKPDPEAGKEALTAFARPRPAVPATDGDAASALEGIKVVEFGGYAAGPQIGKNLANFGATVVHVESHGRPDGFRTEYPPYKDGIPGVDRAAMFNFFNDCKLGVTVDMKKPGGRELTQKLVAWSDVVIENMRPGVVARLGVGYAEMKKANPGLIMLSTCNMGQTGPRANTPGFGSQLSALAGFCGLTGVADGPPMLLFGPYIDFIASTLGTAAALAALEQRRRTGRGCWIDVSQYECGLHFLAGALLDLERTGRALERAGNWDPVAIPHNAYACRDDQWLALSCFSDAQFAGLAEVMAQGELARDPRFATADARRANLGELDAIIARWAAPLTAEAAAIRLQEAEVNAYPVNTVADLFTDPQLAHFGIWRVRRHPVVGDHNHLMPPFILSATPGDVTRAAPCLGEHNEIICKEFLGLNDAEYAERVQEGCFD